MAMQEIMIFKILPHIFKTLRFDGLCLHIWAAFKKAIYVDGGICKKKIIIFPYMPLFVNSFWKWLSSFKPSVMNIKLDYGSLKGYKRIINSFCSHSWIINNFSLNSVKTYFISFVLGVDRNDIPLLMSVANCIDPSLPSSLTLIPMRK